VKFEVWACVYGNVIALPPDVAVNQPAKAYPERVGVPGEDEMVPLGGVEPELIAEPPCVL